MMDKPEAFPILLKKERLKRSWSQSYLAQELNCDTRTIARWEKNQGRPNLFLIQNLCRLLNKSAEELGLQADVPDSLSQKPEASWEDEREQLHIQLRSERILRGWSQEKLAGIIGSTARSVARWENGTSVPHPKALQKIQEIFSQNKETTDLSDLSSAETSRKVPISNNEDLGEAPDPASFYGRSEECTILTDWIMQKRCQFVLIQGIGGIGKTALASRTVELVREDFQYIFWRSLKNAPPLTDILKACLRFLAPQDLHEIPSRTEDQTLLLLSYLRANRCLLVLDNLESILQPGERVGSYRRGYEDYAEFFRVASEASHSSCILLTSREKPDKLAYQGGQEVEARSMHLAGMNEFDARVLLARSSLQGSDNMWTKLISRYVGNPLALKLIASFIQDLFGGDIAQFLHEQVFVFGSVSDLLHEQFQRLSVLERDLIFWLAIEREAISLDEIMANMLIRHPLKGTILSALESLLRRSLVERQEQRGFFLQPVVLEFVTDILIDAASKEFLTFASHQSESAEILLTWRRFAFLKALSKDYVRNVQKRLILAPLAERLEAAQGKTSLAHNLIQLLDVERQIGNGESYLAGNILNLLIYLKSDLRGLNFSGLMIRQAYLSDSHLQQTNFTGAIFRDTVFTSTFGAILSVAFSPAGDLLAAGTATGEIWLYRVDDGMPLQICQGHTDGVWALSFSPDGQLLASGSDDQTVRIWQLPTGKQHSLFTTHTDRVRAVSFSPDGSMLASGSNDQQICLWNVQSGLLSRVLQGHSGWIWSLAWHPAGHLLASGSADQTIRLWDVSRGENSCLHIFEGHTHIVRSLSFHPSGHLLVSASDDGTVRVWETWAMRCTNILQGHNNRVWSVAFSSDGTIFASGSEDCTVRIWETETYRCTNVLQAHTSGVRAVAFSVKGVLASGGDDQMLRFWEKHSGNSLRTFQGYINRVWSLAFMPSSGLLASVSEDETIRLWDVETGNTLRSFTTSGYGIRSLAASPNAALLAGVGADQLVHCWNLADGQQLKPFNGHTNWVRAVAFHPSGQLLASSGEDHKVLLWDILRGQLVRSLVAHSQWVRAVAFHPAGQLLASGSDDQTIRIWDVQTGTCLYTLQGHTQCIRALVFHPTKPLLFSSSEDKTIRIWDIETGACTATLVGHTHRVLWIDIDPTGRYLLSCGDDLSIRLWDIDGQNAQIRIVDEAHSSRIRSAIYSPDGSWVASCGDDGTIKIWDASTLAFQRQFISERPYENMNITTATGLTEAQKSTLSLLGAFETI